MEIHSTQFILYVADQQRSTAFYSRVLKRDPVLHVPGMTEFMLSSHCKLGLMPEDGIARIITPVLPHPAQGSGIPRCELYLMVDDLDEVFRAAILADAKVLSPASDRDWGDRVAYVSDPDGHVLAFAVRIGKKPE